jgi:hypothetical protein
VTDQPSTLKCRRYFCDFKRTTTTGGSGTTADSAATTPVVDPKVASEFGLDADQLPILLKNILFLNQLRVSFLTS